ncbi:MAG: TIR domain-containing protein [Actinomycetota bacterium]|nr:TIR domain-containing protein [Actinomycetota bacterium]
MAATFPGGTVYVTFDVRDPAAAAVVDRLETAVARLGHGLRRPYRGVLEPHDAVVAARLASASVAVVVIGRGWSAALGDPSLGLGVEVDEVVRAGRRNGLRVVPVLLAGASMPDPVELPSGLAAVAEAPYELASNDEVADLAEHLVPDGPAWQVDDSVDAEGPSVSGSAGSPRAPDASAATDGALPAPDEEWSVPAGSGRAGRGRVRSPAKGAPRRDAGGRPGRSAAEPVGIGAAAPRQVPRSQPFVVRLAAYAPDLERAARRRLRDGRRAAVKLGVHETRWRVGERIEVRCAGVGLEVVEPVRDLTWDGRLLEAVFDVAIRDDFRPDEAVVRLSVLAAGLPVAEVRLHVGVGRRSRWRRATAATEAVRAAFASYASADRDRVLDVVRGYRGAGVEVFLDCLDLKASEVWKERLRREIEGRELFLLFWSSAAARSPWVGWEIDTVVDHRGTNGVHIEPLEAGVAPHDRLAHLQHGDVAARLRGSDG